MNSRMQDYVTPASNKATPREGLSNILDPDFVIEHRDDGFCDRDMTLTFSNNKLYNPELLPAGTTKESATTQAMLTSSLSFTEHEDIVYHITEDNLAKLYHVVDNPEVVFNKHNRRYVAARHHYIDRDTMTGIVIHCKLEYGYYGVVGIFSPRGYGKIDAYNEFANKYLTIINVDTINSNIK